MNHIFKATKALCRTGSYFITLYKKVNYRFDTIKCIRFIYHIYELLKVLKNCGNFVCCCFHWLREFLLGPCFQILFLMPFIAQQLSCQERSGNPVFKILVRALTLLYVPSSFAIILMGKRELVTLLSLFSWCLVIVVWLFFAMPWVVCSL